MKTAFFAAAAVVLFVLSGCQMLQNDWGELKEAGQSTVRLLEPGQGAVTSQGAEIDQRLSNR